MFIILEIFISLYNISMGLKSLILLLFLSTPCFGQNFFNSPKKYENIDSLSLERITIYSSFDYDDDKIINMGDGEYLIELPHKDKIIIATDKDREKAIILYNSYCFGRHKEFFIKENEKRLILWYKDSHIYCGYIYDKIFKVCKYFESKVYD